MVAASDPSGGMLGTTPARRGFGPGTVAGDNAVAGAGAAARLFCVVAMDPSALPGRASPSCLPLACSFISSYRPVLRRE